MAKNNSEAMIAHVHDWEDSGMSIRDFARKIGITKGKFSYWVSKVKASGDITNQQPQFIDLGMVTKSEKPAHGSPGKTSPPNPQMELIFPSGLVLKIYG